MKKISEIFPKDLRNVIDFNASKKVTDIRILADKPLVFMEKDKEIITDVFISPSHIDGIIRNACENSLYSYGEYIKEGFITLKGGHRMGICGRAVYEENKIVSVADIGFINIRKAREIKGAANNIISSVITEGIIHNTLIISPPGKGKTTLLRDIARILGDMENMRPSIIDSRFEIGAQYMGVPSMDIGLRSFLLSGYSKKDGFSHSIRSLSSNVVLCDEIGAEDFSCIDFALKSGVSVIATVHGNSLKDIQDKFDVSCFSRFIILKNEFGKAEII